MSPAGVRYGLSISSWPTCRLVSDHDSAANGWKGVLMRLAGLVGERGSTPSDWRATFLRRSAARIAREVVLEWNPERLLVAHGECVESGAARVIATALAWI